jgi:hypothetical protein
MAGAILFFFLLTFRVLNICIRKILLSWWGRRSHSNDIYISLANPGAFPFPPTPDAGNIRLSSGNETTAQHMTGNNKETASNNGTVTDKAAAGYIGLIFIFHIPNFAGR